MHPDLIGNVKKDEKMILEAFRMNEQTVSKILFKGDWGRCPNKQFEQICTGLPCLRSSI